MARAISPAVGVTLLAGCVVCLCAVVGTLAFAYEPLEPARPVSVDAAVDAEANEVTLTLDRGGPLDVRALTLVVEVDGVPLERQPTVPAYSQSGFKGFPTGPFNAGADPRWTAGQSASLVVAETTNGPLPEPGSTVTVRLFEDELPIAVVEATAR